MSLHSRSFIKGCCLSSGSLSPLLMDWILEFIVGAGYLLFAPLDPLSTIHLFCALGNWPLWTPSALNHNWVQSIGDWFIGGRIYSSGSLSVQMLCSFPQDQSYEVICGYPFWAPKLFSSLLSFSGIGVIIALLLLVSFNPTYTFITSSFIKLSSFLA